MMQSITYLKTVFSSKIIDLTNSEARDNLANERTFLAWMRTGFAISALGIVIGKLQINDNTHDDRTFYKILALLFIFVGMLCIIVGLIRYAHVRALLEKNKYPTTGVTVAVVAILGLGVFLATFIILLL
jgi:putative membrane protein